MQTFLPYADIIKSVQCLDNKRLGKQRVEAMQILKALTNPNYGWQSHPAVKMWKRHNRLLEIYMNCCIIEWRIRGFNNNMRLCRSTSLEPFYLMIRTVLKEPITFTQLKYPKWFGNEDFHNSHKSNLLRKDKKYYSQFNWNVPDDLPYVWPV